MYPLFIIWNKYVGFIFKTMRPRQFKIRSFNEQFGSLSRANPSQRAQSGLNSYPQDQNEPYWRELTDMFKTFMSHAESQQRLPPPPLPLVETAAIYEPQPRDRDVKIPLPQIKDGKVSESALKKWITLCIKQIYSSSFNYFTKNDMSFEQAKIYCSQNIFKNIVRLNQHYSFTAEDFSWIDSHVNGGLLDYMSKKYPLTDNPEVNKKLEAVVNEIDNMDALTNDYLAHSKIVFEYREDGNYNDLIMEMLNELMGKVDNEPEDEEDELPLNLDFENFMGKLFDNVEDEQWMEKPIKDNIYKNLQFKHHSSYQHMSSQEMEAYKQRIMRKNEHQQKYKSAVREYTSYTIDRKIPENTPNFSEKQVENGKMIIKNPKILRILTKWCDQLWLKFEENNYYSNRSEIIKVQKGGNVNSLTAWMRKSIDKLMTREKASIEKYVSDMVENNYYMQANLLAREMQITGNEEVEELERISGKFASKVVQNLHSYTIAYLNRLIHGLCRVSKEFYEEGRLSQYNYWPSPPNLVSFSIGDMLRCRFISKEKQVIRIYQELLDISRTTPEKLKIARIKDRLHNHTNDILINIRYNESVICEIQLAVKSKAKSSDFIRCANLWSHYIYQLQRSKFGPLTQFSSIWISHDPRADIYQSLIQQEERKQEIRQHPCMRLNKRVQLERYDNPFICSQCNVTYFHNNYLKQHSRCTNCNLFICGKCRLEVETDDHLKSSLIINAQIKQHTLKRVHKHQKLPNFGICIFIESKTVQYQIFTVINYNQKDYLLAQTSSHEIYNVQDISTPQLNAEFRKKYLIFEYSSKGKIKKIKKKDAIKSYILPTIIRKNYEKQRESISLMDLQLNDEVCTQILTVGTSLQKENIKNLFLADNKLSKLPFDPEEFENLKWVNLSRNPIKSLRGIESLEKLKKVMLINCKLDQFPEELCDVKEMEEITLNSNPLLSITPSIKKLTNLKELSVPNCQLSALPPQLGHCVSLRVLKVQKNSLTQLPESLCDMIQLQNLTLSANQLTHLPPNINKLKYLRHIDLKHNLNFKQLPEGISELQELQTLNCSFTALTSIPSLSKLEYLVTLRLNDTHLTQLPPSIGDPKYLIRLDLSNNPGLVLPEQIGQLEHLQELNLSKCRMPSLPSSFSHLKKLEILSLSTNRLQSFSDGVFEKMVKLRELYISMNQLQVFPDLSNCDEMEKLYCYGNKLTSVPHGILSNLMYLEELSFANNQLQEFPTPIIDMNKLSKLNMSQNMIMSVISEQKSKEIEGFNGQVWPNMLEINLDSNNLASIPDFVCKCQKMTKMHLSDNRLSQLPPDFKELSKLTMVSLKKNKFEEYPAALPEMSNLRAIDLSGNPISRIPGPSIIGTSKLKKLVLRQCPLEQLGEWEGVKWAITKEADERSAKGSLTSKTRDEDMLMADDAEEKPEGKEDANLLPQAPNEVIQEQMQADAQVD